MKFFLLFFFTLLNLNFECLSQTTEITSRPVSTTSFVSTSSLSSSPETTSSSNECHKLNSTCEECLANKNCFYCFEDNTCKEYKVNGLFPEGCKASQSRWFSCSGKKRYICC